MTLNSRAKKTSSVGTTLTLDSSNDQFVITLQEKAAAVVAPSIAQDPAGQVIFGGGIELPETPFTFGLEDSGAVAVTDKLFLFLPPGIDVTEFEWTLYVDGNSVTVGQATEMYGYPTFTFDYATFGLGTTNVVGTYRDVIELVGIGSEIKLVGTWSLASENPDGYPYNVT